MARGAQKVGEAFVELGGKTSPLAKDLNTAKQMTNSAMGEMGKMASRFAIGLAGAAGITGGAVGLVTGAVKEFAGFEESMAGALQEIANRGENVDDVMVNLAADFRAIKGEFRSGIMGAGISSRQLAGMARSLLLAGIGVDDFASKARAAIYHSDRMGISIEEATKRMVQVFEGAPAVTAFRLPIAETIPAPEQFAEVIARGQDISVATTKLRTMSGAWQRFSRLWSDFFALVGAGVGAATPLAMSPEDIARLRKQAARQARDLTGKSAEERAARRRMGGISEAGVLTDDEIDNRIRARDAKDRPRLPLEYARPPAPNEVFRPGKAEGLLEELVNVVKDAVEQRGEQDRTYMRERGLDSPVRIDYVPVED
jgi:hypothetical protein